MTHAPKLLLALALAALVSSACANSASSDAEPMVATTESTTGGPSAPEPAASSAPIASATPASNTAAIDAKLLVGTWVQSYEEGAVYRPMDFKAEWPPSHFRGTFTINADGTGSWAVLAPDDAHFAVKGTWKLFANGTLEFTSTEGNRMIKVGAVRSLAIASLSKDKLEQVKDSPSLHNAL